MREGDDNILLNNPTAILPHATAAKSRARIRHGSRGGACSFASRVSILGSNVVGLDVGSDTAARINYLPYDGRHFPVRDQCFDAVLLCYVLHHAQDSRLVLNEVARVLRDGGLTIIYEDIPSRLWDRAICWTHNRQWRSRTGPCQFRLEHDWRRVFNSTGFEIVSERSLSRWRNLAHPVLRRFFVLRWNSLAGVDARSEGSHKAEPSVQAEICVAM